MEYTTEENTMITRLKHHEKCEVGVVQMPKNNKHHSRLICVDCGVHIQWLSKKDSLEIRKIIEPGRYVGEYNVKDAKEFV
jgi:hypothetical protein